MGLVTGLALGATAIGAGLSAVSANKASKRAAATSQSNTDANNALARDIYGQNRAALNPFMQRGNAAGNQINALLGLGGQQFQGGPAQFDMNSLPQGGMGMPNAMTQFQPAMSAQDRAGLGDSPGYQFNGAPSFLSGGQQSMPMGATGVMPSGGSVTANPAGPQTAQQAANNAFDIFRNSTGYQFRLGEGMDGVTSAYAGIGALQSGAAMRGINEYGQNFASNEFGNYLNALGGQQAIGAGSASALAGVGQNFAGTIIDSNNFNAQNQMQAQLGRQNVFGNMLGTAGGLGLGFLSGRG